jgi:hypothetical protein
MLFPTIKHHGTATQKEVSLSVEIPSLSLKEMRTTEMKERAAVRYDFPKSSNRSSF